MPKFITAHITSCMTRQDVERLVKRFAEESSDGVRNLRTQCDTVLGRMVCEWEAPDREALVRWLAGRNVRFRGQEEWVMHVQMELAEGKIVTS
ncbi:MAG: hypothetical protein EXS64_07540 [Candidatus Latescibacteria bacterium]|nr:hypothetical protein [Candidatus Latescibacterota bacterium]